MSPAIRTILAAALLASGAGTVAAQSATRSPSPTLPSDTLEANYAPRSVPGPMPQLAPSLPSDTLPATGQVDSIPPGGSPAGTADSSTADSASAELPGAVHHYLAPLTPGDSSDLRELRMWIERHPGFMAPPPARAVLVRV